MTFHDRLATVRWAITSILLGAITVLLWCILATLNKTYALHRIIYESLCASGLA